MDPLLADRLLVLLVAVAVVLVAGAVWRAAERRRRRHDFDVPVVDPTTDLLTLPGEPAPPGLGAAGSRATLVVVGTRGCSDCARTLATLRQAFAADDDVEVHHVLAEQAPDLVDRFRVRTAPTVLLADGAGHVVGVHPGAVDADVARQALRAVDAGEAPFAQVRR